MNLYFKTKKAYNKFNSLCKEENITYQNKTIKGMIIIELHDSIDNLLFLNKHGYETN